MLVCVLTVCARVRSYVNPRIHLCTCTYSCYVLVYTHFPYRHMCALRTRAPWRLPYNCYLDTLIPSCAAREQLLRRSLPQPMPPGGSARVTAVSPSYVLLRSLFRVLS